MVHLADDVKAFGYLDSISCFPFENYLGFIKSLIRSPNKPLAQLVKRLSEQDSPFEYSRQLELKEEHTAGPNKNISGTQYKILNFENNLINVKSSRNKYVFLKNEKLVKVLNIIKASADGEIYLIYQNVPIKGDLYSYPCSSKSLGIFKVNFPEKKNLALNYKM